MHHAGGYHGTAGRTARGTAALGVLAAALLVLAAPSRAGAAGFIRGDANGDGNIDISDARYTLNYLFLGGPEPPCLAAADSNDDDAIDISDAIRTLRFLFAGTVPPPPPPWPSPGGDPTPGRLSCASGGPGENEPPAVILQSPAQGTIVASTQVDVRGRITDDGTITRLLVGGEETALPEPPPRESHSFRARATLQPGPNLIRVEAVDDRGRTGSAELALGAEPLLRREAFAAGLALHVTAGTGYDEIETILAPFAREVPAQVDAAVRGRELYRGSFLGADLRVTGNRVEVPAPPSLDLFASGDGGGRLGLQVSIPSLTLFADGESDYGFLGTDRWTATWNARDLVLSGTVTFHPAPGGLVLEAVSGGFALQIGSSDLTVSGFLDPLGIFDSLLNLLAGVFRSEIEAQVRQAVEQTAEQELVPALAGALSGLRLALDLEPLAMDSRFADVVEALAGLSVQLEGVWQAATRDPRFPAYPGSTARFAPFPGFPLTAAPAHPVDVEICLSTDTLNQALAELTATGALAADLAPAEGDAPFPLTAGAVALLTDRRLLELPGLSGETPVVLRLEARRPVEILPGEGPGGRALLPEGASWRFFRGRSGPGPSWAGPSFDDSTWEVGPSGFGYSSDPAELPAVRTELGDMSSGAYTSLYLRSSFQLPGTLEGVLILRVLHDDAFVAYLNGLEVARVNAPGVRGEPVPHDALALVAIEPQRTEVDLTPWRGSLRPAGNTIAVVGLNAGPGSSDFVLLPEIVERPPAAGDTVSSVPARLLLPDLELSFIADLDGDGAGRPGSSGGGGDVELFAYSLTLLLDVELRLARDPAGGPVLVIGFEAADGPDPDTLPDALAGGAAGIDIAVAREAVDARDEALLALADVLLEVFGRVLSESLAGLEFPAVLLPELVFDLDQDGAPDVRLEISQATLGAADTDGSVPADWTCIAADLEAIAE